MKILVVEDEENIRKVIKKILEINEFEVLEARDGAEAMDIFYSEKIDLIILDWMLPKVNGIEVLKMVRQESSLPILMLTAKSQEDDEVEGLEVGANDYLKKPFSLKILVTRVKKLLNLIGGKKKYGILEVDLNNHKVYIKGKDTNISPKEFELLNYLILNRGIALNREKILADVWDFAYDGDYRTVDTHIKTLRKKIGAEHITTVRGIGYKFEVDKR
ncbi:MULTISPECIES: response regulator transcription factor [Psychrilyobacter]|uniref:Response regulator n=1 Tax=Psychrilyobacter piezotolerans TaxID=2293438 RepID=A0ABX9KL96_9FUSO|nr:MULTISPECIES: response regulator transcription factor [Psychrilyobacter]MCS5423057.1 response regulator transcription factor [Psychrilyobacter sp. S5]NDI76445.1 response regulator transcription factor [Psychrilyobacter piezotolerans]RDE66041.1 DNA-binding response regulator [Psychrilyobacter sp. S5]REI43219.1 response regulator [Psychrilyobacter piezotolerans]